MQHLGASAIRNQYKYLQQNICRLFNILFFTPDQFAAKLRVNKNEIEYPCWSC